MRRGLTLLGLASLLLLVGVAVLWGRSRNHSDVVAFFTPAGHPQGLASDRGGLVLFFTDVPFGREKGWGVDFAAASREEFDTKVHPLMYDPTAKVWSAIGFKTAAGQVDLTPSMSANYKTVLVPYWFLLVALAALPAWALPPAWKRWRWRRLGLCRSCGYDIRASTGRCPECGAVIPPVPEDLPEGAAPAT